MVKGRMPRAKTITLPKGDYKAFDRLTAGDPMVL
jgi:hypothetical protein